jgi:hypothetical protein
MSAEVTLTLSPSAALVLFDWLARLNHGGDGAFADQAEQRVLWDLEAMLESALAEPFSAEYETLLRAARDAVRDATE